MGIGDLSILISSIHAISKKITKPVTVLAQKNTRANAILKYDPYIEEVIELIQPKFIQLNGKKPRLIFERIYEEKFQPMKTIAKGCHSGTVEVKDRKIPTIAHNFSGMRWGLNGEIEWDTMYDEWTGS